MTTQTGLTIEQFLAAEWPPDTQLVDGEVVMNDPTFRHQEITLRILVAIRSQPGGRAGVGGNWTLAPGQVFKPDVWWASEGRRPAGDAVRSDSPPDLVVEVRSPGTWRYDVGRKRIVYEQAGVRELWLVDTPARSVIVHRRSHEGAPTFDVTLEFGPGETVTSPLLVGLGLAIDPLFAD